MRERACDGDRVDAHVLEEAAVLGRDRRLQHPRCDAIDRGRDPQPRAHVPLEHVPARVEDHRARYRATRFGGVEWREARECGERQREEADNDDKDTSRSAHWREAWMTGGNPASDAGIGSTTRWLGVHGHPSYQRGNELPADEAGGGEEADRMAGFAVPDEGRADLTRHRP